VEGKMGKGETGRGLEPPPLQISGYATDEQCHTSHLNLVG